MMGAIISEQVGGIVGIRSVGPGQKLVDAALQVAAHQLGDDVFDIGLGLDIVEFACGDERGEDCPVLGSALGTREQAILSRQSQRPDRALDRVGVDFRLDQRRRLMNWRREPPPLVSVPVKGREAGAHPGDGGAENREVLR